MYELLTKYLPKLNKDKFGEWVFDDKNDGSPEHPLHFPFVNYDDIVGEIWQAIYDTVDQHPELDIVKWYNEILKNKEHQKLADAMNNTDVSKEDGRKVLLLLFAMTRKERFCEGTLAHYFDDGSVRRWIQRLKDIDDGVESVPSSELRVKEEKKPVVFTGTLRKFRLISNNICFGPEPMPDDEVEQRLSVTSGGGIWLTRYRYGGIDDRPNLLGKEKIPASADTIKYILETVGRAFQDYDDVLATDVGVWTIDLTDAEGKTTQISGSLISDSLHDLSDYIREMLGREDLFLFDGNPDRVDRIEVQYDRHLEIEIKEPVNPEQPYAIWDYHEEVKIDRATETIEHFRQIFDECDVRNIYHVAGGVPNFLDEMDTDALSEVSGNPPDVYVDPHKTDSYKILVTTKHGGARETIGTFDKNGLPKDWPDFAEDLYKFLSFYGIGEFFDERVYGKARRRINDLIFCNVVFENGGKEYCYLSDEDYDAGDLVVVRAGKDNHEAVVRIESVEYHPAEDAPFPLDKIKHVLRKFDEDKDKSLLK